MRLAEFDFDLPEERIAQYPLERRDDSRLLELKRASGQISDRRFSELPSLLQGEELVVLNNTRVIPARLFGRRARGDTVTERVEVLLARRIAQDTWEALVRPGRKMPVGERVEFRSGHFAGEVLSRGQGGLRTIRFQSLDGASVDEHLKELGHVPLPP